MALELRQQLKLSQQLVMTPQLQQAIKLLQLSRLELMETVQQELLENPFLEESADDGVSADDLESRPESREDEVYEKDINREADWEDYLGDFASTTRQSTVREAELPEELSSLEARFSSQPSLVGHLLWQLRLSSLTEEQKEIAEVIIGNLSSSGYLEASLEELSDLCGYPPAEVETVLKYVQRCDPVGVAARTPQECLLVQMEVHGYDKDRVLYELVRDHLEDLEQRRYKPLLRKFKLTMEDLGEYLDFIQTLDPMPGASYGDSEPTYVSPDVYVYNYNDDFVIVLNDDGLPQLQMSSSYEGVDFSHADAAEKEYMQEKMRAASWLIKSLHQRQRTLYKVMESIVRHQREFFEKGVAYLKPLILRDIADDISMHESTVSRITTSKYVATPHGIFELKFFFNSALTLDDGSEVGSESVKSLIKQLISEEDAQSPLSDERIGEILKERLKVNIARRTVAKYRTAMDIEPSSRRRAIF